jgi:hypothetical protein
MTRFQKTKNVSIRVLLCFVVLGFIPFQHSAVFGQLSTQGQVSSGGTINAASQAQALSGNDYFHQGAQQFIYNSLDQAIQTVEEGLRQFPNHAKLQELYERLMEQKEQQENQQNNQQNQDSQNQDGENDEQDSNENQEQEENQQEENSENQDNESEEEQEENSSPEGNQEENETNESESNAQPSPDELKDLSKEEAQKILQALAQKEKELLKEFKKAKTSGSKTHEKDW